MTIQSDYTAGTITLTNGSVVFSGVGTAWATALAQAGDTIIDVPGSGGNDAVVASITSDTAGTLTKSWEGPTLTGVTYRLRFQPDGSAVAAKATNLIAMIGGTALSAISKLTPAVDRLPYYSGAATAALTPLTATARSLLDDTSTAAMLATLGALPLSGGAMTGVIANFASTGIDDNASSTAITINGNHDVGIGTAAPAFRLHVVHTVQDAKFGIQTTAASRAAFLYLDGTLDNWGGIEHRNSSISNWFIGERGTNASDIAFYTGVSLTERMRILAASGNVGIGMTAPANPLSVNRSADGVIVDFASGGVVQGNVSIAGATTSYNAFVGSHYIQLKPGQKELPLGSVLIATGEMIIGSVVLASTEKDVEVSRSEAVETVTVDVDEIVTEAIKTTEKVKGKNSKGASNTINKFIEVTEYQFDNKTGDVVTKAVLQPLRRKVTKTIKQLKTGVRLDEKTGKLYRKVITKTPRDISGVAGKEYFSFVDTTTKAGDKRVYGVWHGKMSDDANGQSFGQDELPVYLVSQVGLFKSRVTDTNGDIENGDWLETSNRPMEAQKQSAPEKLNSTLGKALMNVDWSKVPIDPDIGYKWKLIPVIF